ncbi:MAG: GAF domain-containing protein [Odoribacteraceae bacterium]|nr:GAF domain-containing protein [Odoribacteraceae bacterium]
MNKTAKYDRLHEQLRGYFHATADIWARLATIEAVLHHKMKFLWTGVYVLSGDALVVRSYQGPVACQCLRDGGVCWSAIRRGDTVIVGNVDEFPGHVACNPASRSEIVIPLRDAGGNIFGCLDIDSDRLDAFDEEDEAGLKKILSLLHA